MSRPSGTTVSINRQFREMLETREAPRLRYVEGIEDGLKGRRGALLFDDFDAKHRVAHGELPDYLETLLVHPAEGPELAGLELL